jgi:hypothetical protein
MKRNCTENFSGERPDETESTAWQENFDMFSSTGEYRYNQYFTSSVTPNGWNAGQGLYVRERRDAWWTPDDVVVTQTTANVGMALQMLGSGFGYLAYTGSTNGLDGIDTVTLKARLSQGLEMGDFAYYEEGMTLTNYGFCFLPGHVLTNIESKLIEVGTNEHRYILRYRRSWVERMLRKNRTIHHRR